MKNIVIYFAITLLFTVPHKTFAESACQKSVGASPAICQDDTLNSTIDTCPKGSKKPGNNPSTPKCTKDQQDDNLPPDPTTPKYEKYDDAIEAWKYRSNAAEMLATWIGTHFVYDIDRASGPRPTPYTPSELYESKKGICVDLTRFTQETLLKIAPQTDPKYLKIDFEPCKIKGTDVSLHWMVQYKKGDKFYFMGDTKHPKKTYGPCDSTQEFIEAYQKHRCRKIRCYNVRDSYKMEIARKAMRAQSNPPSPITHQ